MSKGEKLPVDQIRAGRLGGVRDEQLLRYLSSMDADRWIAEADVLVDIAHSVMLHHQGILDTTSAQAILRILLQFHDKGIPREAFSPTYEDIHAGIEAVLMKKIGHDAGGRMHTGRSRNDEVATCLRIRLREEILGELQELVALRETLLGVAADHLHTIMPGFTHLQHAQPTTLAHYLLGYEQAFSRDFARLSETYARVNASPLGAAAFASTGFGISRSTTADLLGFDAVLENSMDAVATRDYAIETLAAQANCMVNASRFCEELILWSSTLVRFIQLDDRYCSSSSIMPQKKNPDTAELLRGKCGTVTGALISAIAIMKALPQSYNRDMQELSPHLWKGCDTVRESLPLLSGMIGTATFHTERMREEAGRGYATATELADILVRDYDLPFRQAHTIVGRAVQRGTLDLATLEAAAQESAGVSLLQKGLTETRVRDALDPVQSVAVRAAYGGPSPVVAGESLKNARQRLAGDRAVVAERSESLTRARDQLLQEARGLLA
ncbi:MAG: argininosuccinate lyase [Methanomicrobiales archaeon]|nr:argininosuccinate lyase [Methanomicrobiales archaeon]